MISSYLLGITVHPRTILTQARQLGIRIAVFYYSPCNPGVSEAGYSRVFQVYLTFLQFALMLGDMPKYGFTFQWMYHHIRGRWSPKPAKPDFAALDFIAKHGFNYVRVPVSYWFWTKEFDYQHPQERVFSYIDRYIQACMERGLHLCLSMHRAPGHCIDAPDRERDNLWINPVAQAGFQFLWELFARRYQTIPSSNLSFELISDPPAEGERLMECAEYERLAVQVVKAVRAIDPNREIIVTGLDRGRIPLLGLDEVPVIQSCHAYEPMSLTHFETKWWLAIPDAEAPEYPGVDNLGKSWNRDTLIRFLQPWRELEASGTPVQVGNFGCFNRTENWTALAWFTDLMGLFRDYGWGYCLGGFDGPLGVVNHGRRNTYYEVLDGYRVDRRLMELLKESRVKPVANLQSVH